MTDDFELLGRLLDVHDGDDRCGCLRDIISKVYENDIHDALQTMRVCIAEHPAGITYRRSILRDLATD